jgi:hypothetical protein
VCPLRDLTTSSYLTPSCHLSHPFQSLMFPAFLPGAWPGPAERGSGAEFSFSRVITFFKCCWHRTMWSCQVPVEDASSVPSPHWAVPWVWNTPFLPPALCWLLLLFPVSASLSILQLSELTSCWFLRSPLTAPGSSLITFVITPRACTHP